MIEHAGAPIYGTHESPAFNAPAWQAVRTGFSGVIGESEIRQGRKGRPITCRIKIHNRFGSAESLFAYIRSLDERVGQHGTLRVLRVNSVGAPAFYPNCTFEGFTKDPSPDSGALPDNVGLLDGANPSWWIEGVLQFYQLSTAEG